LSHITHFRLSCLSYFCSCRSLRVDFKWCWTRLSLSLRFKSTPRLFACFAKMNVSGVRLSVAYLAYHRAGGSSAAESRCPDPSCCCCSDCFCARHSATRRATNPGLRRPSSVCPPASDKEGALVQGRGGRAEHGGGGGGGGEAERHGSPSVHTGNCPPRNCSMGGTATVKSPVRGSRES